MRAVLKTLMSVWVQLILVACGSRFSESMPSSLTTSLFPGSSRSSLNRDLDLRAFARPIVVSDDSHYLFERPCGRTTCRDTMLIVELAVCNDSPEKSVGLVWSSDGWKTQSRAVGEYRGIRSDGLERWRVMTDVGAVQGDLEYAAFVEMNGDVSWEPFNNHNPMRTATPSRPIVSGAQSWQRASADGDAGMSVDVDLFPFESDRNVLLWTRWEGEREFRSARCIPTNRTRWLCKHTFAEPAELSTSKIEYFIEATQGGKVMRDDNSGRFYSANPFPGVSIDLMSGQAASVTRARSVAGVLGFICSSTSSSSETKVEMRIDSASQWQPGGTLFTSTVPLAPGAHTVQCRASLVGDRFARLASLNFEVARGLVPQTSLQWPVSDDFVASGSESFERVIGFDHDDRVYVQMVLADEMRVARAHMNNDKLETLEYLDAYGGGHIGALAVSPRDSVWAVLDDSDELVSWDNDGRFRREIGADGRVSLGLGNGAGHRSLVVVGELVAVSSPWEREIQIYSGSGQRLSTYRLEESLFSSRNAGRTVVLEWDGVSLWWFDQENLIRFSIRDGVATLESHVKTDSAVSLEPVGMVRLERGGFMVVSSQPAGLFELSLDGTWTVRWLGSNRKSGVWGDLVFPSALGRTSAGEFVVGVSGASPLARFAYDLHH